MNDEETIEISSSEFNELADKFLEAIFEYFDEPISARETLICIEAMRSLTDMFHKQLEAKGLKIGTRREEIQ